MLLFLKSSKHRLVLVLCVFLAFNFCVDANPPPNIKDIYIIGNDQISSVDISNMLIYSRAGVPLNTDELQKDLDALLATGYFDEVSARLSSLNDGTLIYITVKESERKVASFNVNGEDHKYANNIDLKQGEIITQDKLSKEAVRINDDLAKNGSFSEVQNISINKNGDIIFNIKKKVIEKITFEGLEHTKEWLALKFIYPIAIGVEPTKEKVQEALLGLQGSGYFSEVSAKTIPNTEDNSKLTIVFIVKEQKSGEWRLGGGYNSRSGMVATGGIKNSNINGEGKEVAANISNNSDDSAYSISYRNNYLNKSDNALQINVWKNHYTGDIDGLESYENRKGASISYEKAGPRDLKNFAARIITTFRAENQDIKSDDDHTKNVLRVISSAIVNNRVRNSVDPHEGTYSMIRYDRALKILGGDTSFDKISAEVKKYIPTSKKSVIAIRAAAQYILGNNIPKGEQVSLGGDRGVRGIQDGNNRGKNGAFLNIEYRHSLSDIVQAAVFADAGKTSGLKTSKAASDVGVGLRIKSGMGLIRLDLAKSQGRAWQTIFGIGQAF